MVNNCPGCLEKQRRTDQLGEENQRVKDQLRYRQRKEKEGFGGSSTPSSLLLLLTGDLFTENINYRQHHLGRRNDAPEAG